MALLSIGSSAHTLHDFHVHSHDCFEVILNLSGMGTAEIQGNTFPFSPGTIHIIPPNIPHKKKAEEGFTDIYFHTDDLPEHIGFTAFNDDAGKTIENMIRMMLSRYLESGKMDAIVDQMYRVTLLLIEEKLQSGKEDVIVENLMERLKKSFNDADLKLADILEDTGYNKDYVRRRFIAYTGVTPGKYVTELRMNYARQLLSQRRSLRLSIADIAMMCGYYDAKYFTRIFKQTTGMTPGNWEGKSVV